MSTRKRRQRSSLVFAWEARASNRFWVGWGTPVFALGMTAIAVFSLWRVEQVHAEERQRLADFWHVRRAVDRYRAMHEGACPTSATQVITEGFARDVRVFGVTESMESFCPVSSQTVLFSAYQAGFAPTRAHGPLE